MNYDDDDRREFAPEDEGSIAPDATDSRAVDDGSYEHVDDSLENGHVGYPDAPEPASHEDDSTAENRCECGTEIAHDRTKCDFCFTNSLDYGDLAVEPDTKRELTGLVHVLVDAKTEQNAISKAKAVYKGLTDDPFTTSIDGIDECELIADLEGELVTRFTREWASCLLPPLSIRSKGNASSISSARTPVTTTPSLLTRALTMKTPTTGRRSIQCCSTLRASRSLTSRRSAS